MVTVSKTSLYMEETMEKDKLQKDEVACTENSKSELRGEELNDKELENVAGGLVVRKGKGYP